MKAKPKFSVIIPARELDLQAGVLPRREEICRGLDVEVLVATGTHPSRQRNLAIAHAKGDVFVFLDSDSNPGTDYFRRVDEHVREGRLVVGGPALLQEPATSRQRIFQELLSQPLLVGTTSSRYASGGEVRVCGDSQLILCNLAVARAVFEEFGGFHEELYPNEENEWMDRIQRSGVECWHDPDLIVSRPQRATWGEFFQMLFNYGRGRTRQFQISRRWDAGRQAPLMALVCGMIILAWKPKIAIRGLLAAWVAAAAAVLLKGRASVRASMAAPIVPIAYAFGQLSAFLLPRKGTRKSYVAIHRWDGETDEFRKIGGD